jgi:hypothetical protein
MSYFFSSDTSGTIWIVSRITGIAVGLANTVDYNLMKSVRDGDPGTTAAQRATIKSYLGQINPLPTVTTLNAAVLNLAQNNANQTAELESYISTH